MTILEDIAAVGAKVDKLTTDFDTYVAKKDAPAAAAVAKVASAVDALDAKIAAATAAVTVA